jgi:SAM-dependent methyltransferase
MLVPDRLRELWDHVASGAITSEAFTREQERLLDGYRATWRRALLEGGDGDLRAGLFRETALYAQRDPREVEALCDGALGALRGEWQSGVDPAERASIEGFYESPTTIYELMGWHSLRDDDGPLAYVLALEIAKARGVKRCLDFGSGIGSGALLFAAAGIAVSLADISSTLLDFCRWRCARRGIPASFIDLKRATLPKAGFDMVLAMDVFEHLADPVEAAETLCDALEPGGVLFARIHAEEDADRPHHIVQDFEPTFARMRELGLKEVWRDGWLWGHQLFEKGV